MLHRWEVVLILLCARLGCELCSESEAFFAGMCFQLIVLAELASPTAEIASTLGLNELGSVVRHTRESS